MNNYLDKLLQEFDTLKKVKKTELDAQFKRLQKQNGKLTDEQIHRMHQEVFSCTDCLKCANCCKTTGPLLTGKDIDRLAKDQGISAQLFISKFLKRDEDGDYVFRSMPCYFLEADNTCRIYHIRPKACREYPHTDRINQKEILSITRRNADVCPAVFEIANRLRQNEKRP